MVTKICKIENCNNKIIAKSFCSKHYIRYKKYGDPNILLRSINGKGARNKNGYTYIYKPQHPNSMKNGKILEQVFVMSDYIRRPLNLKIEKVIHIDGNRSNNNINNLKLENKYEICTIENCDTRIHAKNLCIKHYGRFLKYGDPLQIKGREKGTGSISAQGYKLLWLPNHPNANASGRILEHRLIMSNYLGRPLLDTEYVHHKNGNRLDNRIDNLELCINQSQPPCQRIEDLIIWAKNILEIYEEEYNTKIKSIAKKL